MSTADHERQSALRGLKYEQEANMKHTLRKYLSSRGSALFMVLSTMTALLIVVMAMYFSVVSSRSVQYAVFNQEQSYQSAVSIGDAIMAGLKDGTLGDLRTTLLNMEIYDGTDKNVISSKGNGFEAFGVSGGKNADSNLGAYDIQIMRLDNDAKGNYVYDIATTTSVNGVTETVHSQIYITVSGGDVPPMPTQVFASTGYVPNDIYLDNGVMKTDMFFDNENVYVGAHGSASMDIGGNLYAGGSIINHSYITNVAEKASTWAIRNKYQADYRNITSFKDGSLILIGGDLVLNDGGFSAESGTIDVYVLGDVYLTSNTTSFTNINLYVRGNIYFTKTGTWINSFGSTYVNGNICLAGGTSKQWVWNPDKGISEEVEVKQDPIVYDPTSGADIGTQLKGATGFNGWKKWDDDAPGMTVAEAATKLDTLTATNVYYKWVINDGHIDGKTYTEAKKLDSYVKYIDEDSPDVNKVTLMYNMTTEDGTINGHTVPAYTFVNTLTYEKGVCEGAIIEDSITVGGNQANTYTLIIDTGDKTDNVFTIRVKGNRDMDGDDDTGEDGKETFMWSPDTNRNMMVLVKGRGTVVIDIPDGVIYQDDDQQLVMHYGWYILGGGKEETKNGSLYYESLNAPLPEDKILPFIHRECNCTYTEETSKTVKCTTSDCPNKGKFKKEVYCARHDYTITYCPDCEATLVTKDEDGNYADMCINRVDRDAIDSFLNSNPSIAAFMEGDRDESGNIKKDTNGYPLWYYPTTNIYLVSIGESANIRLAQYVDGTDVKDSAFYGYIYAPYMTFKDKKSSVAGGKVKFCGGLTVLDYVISSSEIYVGCWPERMPADLMGSECYDALDAVAPKTWKIGLLTH